MKKQELKYYKYKIKLGVGNIFASIILILLLILLYFTFDNYYFNLTYNKVLIMIGYFILHELLHYIGYLINKNVKNKDLCLGMCLEKGVMYCRCTNEISRTAVMISLLTPFTVIGIISLIISYIFDMPFLAFLSVSNIAGSYFDILMFIQMLKMPKDIHMLVSMINMKLRDDDMQLSHVLSIYDLDETEFMKRLDENEYFYDESTNQIKTK